MGSQNIKKSSGISEGRMLHMS